MSKYYTDPTTGQRVEIRKTHKFRNFVVFPALGFITLVVAISMATGPAPTTAPTAPVAASPGGAGGGVSTVEVTGDGEANVGIMSDGFSSNTVQLPNTQTLPEGMVTVTVSRTPSLESYQNGGQGDSGTISCEIVRDGEVIDTQTANGKFASVTCTKMY